MKIKLTTVSVDDQDRAPRLHTEVLGFTKKADFSGNLIQLSQLKRWQA